MKKFLTALTLLVICFAFVPTITANAQGTPPYVFFTTQPISTELRMRLDEWLNYSAPVNVPYYAVTILKTKANAVISLTYLALAFTFANALIEWVKTSFSRSMS